MKTHDWIEQIKDEDSKILAQKAVDAILKHLLDLESKLDGEKNDLVAIGKQRAYREVRKFIHS